MEENKKPNVSFRIINDRGFQMILEARIDGQYVGRALATYQGTGKYKIVPWRFAPGAATPERYAALHTVRYRNELPYVPDEPERETR